jgi:hypothetical protein
MTKPEAALLQQKFKTMETYLLKECIKKLPAKELKVKFSEYGSIVTDHGFWKKYGKDYAISNGYIVHHSKSDPDPLRSGIIVPRKPSKTTLNKT